VVAPRSDDEWRAYADTLGDDPRAAWIRASLAAPADERISTTPPIDDELLLSPRLAEHWHRWNFWWWRGFIRGATLMGAMDDPPTSETIDALFADPHTALERLSIMHPIAETVPLWGSVLAEPRPSIVHLAVMNLGPGGRRLAAVPNLRRLDLVGMREPYGFTNPGRNLTAPVDELASASVCELSACDGACDALVNGGFDLPQLDMLEWFPRDPEAIQAGRPMTDLFVKPDSILNRPPARLRSLYCMLSSAVDLLTITSCAAFAQLRHVVIQGAHHEAPIAFAKILDNAEVFRHLESLRVGVGGRFPERQVDEWREALERALPNTKLGMWWESIIEREYTPDVIDADSRDEAGRINALARFMQSPTNRRG
jgi:hypothetical protein